MFLALQSSLVPTYYFRLECIHQSKIKAGIHLPLSTSMQRCCWANDHANDVNSDDVLCVMALAVAAQQQTAKCV
jgi:hypothetical protein